MKWTKPRCYLCNINYLKDGRRGYYCEDCRSKGGFHAAYYEKGQLKFRRLPKKDSVV